MVRTQWLMGDTNRALTDLEMAAFLKGYMQIRPQTEQELKSFPLLWAAYYTQRLCALHTKWKPNFKNRTVWNLNERIKNLPLDAVQMAERAIREVQNEDDS